MDTLPAIAQDRRVVSFGMSGSGKSTLMKSLILAQRNAIVVHTKADAKNENSWQDVGVFITEADRIYERPEDGGANGPGRFIFKPPFEWQEDVRAQNEFFNWVYRGGDRVIYLDEAGDICKSANSFPIELKRCGKNGRSEGLGLWTGTQRPSGIPIWLMSEPNYLFTFVLNWPDDRKRVEEIAMGPMPWTKLRKHEFVWKDEEGIHGPRKLIVSGGPVYPVEASDEEVA